SRVGRDEPLLDAQQRDGQVCTHRALLDLFSISCALRGAHVDSTLSTIRHTKSMLITCHLRTARLSLEDDHARPNTRRTRPDWLDADGSRAGVGYLASRHQEP